MKPVFQTRFGRDGNCYAACLASILEIDLDDAIRLMNAGYSIVSQRMPDGTTHATVWRAGRMVHDPSPRPLSKPDYPVVLTTRI